MSRFVFVHGAWHGAWCWHKVLPQLERAGHQVVAIDLPSLGKDRAPIAAATLEHYADAVCEALAADSDPAILVVIAWAASPSVRPRSEILRELENWCISPLFCCAMAKR